MRTGAGAGSKGRNAVTENLSSAPDGEVIARNFRRIRQNLGLTQERAAELGDVTTGYVGKVETAAVSFGTRAQQKWSKIFGVERTGFLTKLNPGTPVVGAVVERAVVARHKAEEKMEFMPPLTGPRREEGFCLTVATDALYPHLPKGSCLYVATVPTSDVRDDNLIIHAGGEEPESIKETEWQGDGSLILKGIGRGKTLVVEARAVTTLRKIVFIKM